MTSERLLDEIALAGSEHLDAEYVAGYDRKAGLDPTEDLDELRARGLAPDEYAYRLRCGHGDVRGRGGLYLQTRCRGRRLAGDDRGIEAKAAAHETMNVECVQAGFLSYEHRGPPVDFIYTRNALHHLPDFWKGIALKRMADTLAPGGILRLRDLVFSFDLREADARVASWLDTAAAERPEDGWTRAELEAHLRDEFSTFSWLLEPLIREAGFEIDAADYGVVGVHAGYTCIKRSH